MSDVPVKSVKKALDILSILLFEDIERKGVELSVLAGKMRMPANSTHNLLKTMSTCGFVAQTENSRYIPGVKCEQIGRMNRISGKHSSETFKNCIIGLSESVQEAVVFAILLGGRRIVAATSDSNQMIKVDNKAMGSQNIYSLPTGRILTAYASEQELSEIKSVYGNPEGQWDGVKCRNDLLKVTDLIRKQGYCILNPDKFNLVSFACPVLDPEGNLLGALGCYAPLFRCHRNKQNLILKKLKQTSETLGKII